MREAERIGVNPYPLGIVAATDGPIAVQFCQLGEGEAQAGCPRNSRCIPAVVWSELTVRIRELYGEYTLADLVHRAEKAGFSQGQPGYMYFI